MLRITGALTSAAAAAALVTLVRVTPVAAPRFQTSAPERETSADLPGVRLWYHDTGGSGVPVVLIHANTGSSRVWEYQLPVFIKNGFRVVVYDRRGFGRSAIDPAGPQPGTGADDLHGLMAHLGIDRFHIVGTAGGAFVAIDYALSFPGQLRSLVVASSIGGVQDEEFLAMGRRLRPSPQFESLPPEIREVGPAYRAANPEGTRRWVELEKISRPPGPVAPAQTLRNRLTLTKLDEIRMPTLLLTGGADLFAPPAIQQMFKAHIKHAETLVAPDAGHSLYWEQPEVFNRAVLAFVRKH